MEDQVIAEAFATGGAFAVALSALEFAKASMSRRNGGQPVDFAKVAGENGVKLTQILADQKSSLDELKLHTTALGQLNLSFAKLATRLDERSRRE